MVRIIADSTCDLSAENQKKYGLTVVPLTVNFNGRIYMDGVDLSQKRFYEMLQTAPKLPTTSQVNPGEFTVAFRQAVENGDEVIGIFIASDLSGTFQSAVIAANIVDPKHIFIVDARSASFGTALLIRQAVILRDKGLDAAEIAKQIQKLANRLYIYAVIDTLKYLKMGGRISSSAAAVGGLLGICPVMEVHDGKISSVGKIRGEKAGMAALLKHMQETGPDFSYGVAFGHAAASERMNEYIKFFKPYLKTENIYTSYIGSVIGTHTGPGVVGIAFIAKEE